MLTITIAGDNYWDESQELFVTVGDVSVELEHSLASLSKWEERYEKPFLGSAEKTSEEVIGYVEAMCLTPNVPPEVFRRLSQENADAIQTYIDAKMTATWFSEAEKPPPSREIITAELIYYWMFTAGIPMECQNWHLNKLFTLLKVFSAKNAPPKKKSASEIAAERRALNEQRRQKFATRG